MFYMLAENKTEEPQNVVSYVDHRFHGTHNRKPQSINKNCLFVCFFRAVLEHPQNDQIFWIASLGYA